MSSNLAPNTSTERAGQAQGRLYGTRNLLSFCSDILIFGMNDSTNVCIIKQPLKVEAAASVVEVSRLSASIGLLNKYLGTWVIVPASPSNG